MVRSGADLVPECLHPGVDGLNDLPHPVRGLVGGIGKGFAANSNSFLQGSNVQVNGKPTGDWKLSAASGDVRVQLPAEQGLTHDQQAPPFADDLE